MYVSLIFSHALDLGQFYNEDSTFYQFCQTVTELKLSIIATLEEKQ